MSRHRRRPLEAVDDNRSVQSISTTQSRRSRRGIVNPSLFILEETANDAFLVEARSKTPKISNRGGKPPRSKKSLPKAATSDPIDHPTTSNRQPNEEVKKKKRTIEGSRRVQSSAPMEAKKPSIQGLGVSAVKSSLRTKRAPGNELHSNRPAKKMTSRREKPASANPGPKYHSSLVDSKRSSKVDHQLSKRSSHQVASSIVEEGSKVPALPDIPPQASSDSIDSKPILYSSGTRPPTPYRRVDRVDSMDCASDEDSLDLDDPGSLLTQEPPISGRHVLMEKSSFTPAKLDELRKSKVDNPTAISAMLASHPSPKKYAFPLGTSVGGATLHDSPSLDGSELTMRTIEEPIDDSDITMQTMEELGIGKDWRKMDSLLLRSDTYPSSLIEKKFYSPRDTMISAATKEAREKCLSIMQSGRRTLAPATTFPGADGKNLDAVDDKITEAEIINDEVPANSPEVSEREASPPSNRKQVKEVKTEARKPPTIIKLDKPPTAASTSPVFFEYNGELFSHAPLPSGWKVRVSESRKRLYYTHPDYGTSWHCPILNPYGEKSSTEVVNSAEVENQALARQDVKVDTSKFDADETSTTAGSSVLSVESKLTRAESMHVKNMHTDQTDASSTMSESTVTAESHRMRRAVTMEQGDLVSLAHSEETGEFSVQRVDGREIAQDEDESRSITTVSTRSSEGSSKVSKATSKESTGLSPGRNQERTVQELSSPVEDDNEDDDRIAGLTLFDLARGQKQNEGKTLPLFASDRIGSPSELFKYAKSQTAPTELLSIQESRSYAPDQINELVGTFAQGQKRQRGPPVLLLSRLDHAASPSQLIADVGEGKLSPTNSLLSVASSATEQSRRSKCLVTNNANMPKENRVHPTGPIDEVNEFPSPADEVPVDYGGDDDHSSSDSDADDEEEDDGISADTVNTLELRRTTTTSALDTIQPKNRASEALGDQGNNVGSPEAGQDVFPEADDFTEPYDFTEADDRSEPSLASASNTEHSLKEDRQALVDDAALENVPQRASGEVDLTVEADESTETDESDTKDDGEEEDIVGFAGKARSIFHPKIVEMNSVASVSTLGKPSYAGRTHMTQLSARVLNPPHPVCSLQHLDKLQAVLTAQRNKPRQYGRARLALPKVGGKAAARRGTFCSVLNVN
jgi:hypothetical protein